MQGIISDIIIWFSSFWRLLNLRRANPSSIIHRGVYADRQSSLEYSVVLFRDVAVTSSKIGDYTYVQQASQIINADIGPYCSIASEVVIGLVDHPTRFVGTSPVFYDNEQPLPNSLVNEPFERAHIPRTVIGADVWIGRRAMIRCGVTIGVGAVIGAGALVTSDVEPYAIVAGVPARVLRRRFSDELCERLLTSRWWLRSAAELSAVRATFPDPFAFVEALEPET